jgi:hypothetical protein
MDSSTKDMKGFQKFDSIDDGINAMAANLKKTYLDKGLDTIGAIGAVYAPPGAKNDPKNTNAGWPSSVATLYQKFRGEI